ncbi:glycosyltransferase [Psychrobacter sp. 28M-43]|uniref:glycosyltransferase family 2 protein n=1 Tax=Psychrobacter sp. 28M-43 TaxID=2772254 RepID=UPI00168CD384|nr:glycosyltransferase [Psychrobacter sp. 28M-43]QOD11856.1 glycosyltransferase [Psychrobacter sp. 28M-43]
MKKNPLVTYIIPSYNHALYIEQAIESVLKQTYEPIELIIIDDGSKDNTKEVLMKYSNHQNIQIIFNEINLRQSATVNKALKLAKGEFIGLLPSDDWLLPNKVQLQIEKFSQVHKNVGVVYGKGARFFENNDGSSELVETAYHMYKGKITEPLISNGNFIYPITPLFRRNCFQKYPFDESYTAEGEAIYLKLSLSFDFDYVDEVVGVMRDHIGNTGKITDLMYEENLRYLTEFFERDDLPQNIKLLRKPRIAMLKKIKAMEMMINKREYRKGRKLAIQAIRLQPKYIANFKFMTSTLMTFLPDVLTDTLLENFYKKKRSY